MLKQASVKPSLYKAILFFVLVLYMWGCGSGDVDGDTAKDASYASNPSCPQGYKYNSERKICEAEPVYSYQCPLGNYQCVESSPGIAYCSPHECQSINGAKYCTTGPIRSNINANVVGMWWCSGDGTWLMTKSECIENCPYYTCEMDGRTYRGYDTCLTACREVYSCEVF